MRCASHVRQAWLLRCVIQRSEVSPFSTATRMRLSAKIDLKTICGQSFGHHTSYHTILYHTV